MHQSLNFYETSLYFFYIRFFDFMWYLRWVSFKLQVHYNNIVCIGVPTPPLKNTSSFFGQRLNPPAERECTLWVRIIMSSWNGILGVEKTMSCVLRCNKSFFQPYHLTFSLIIMEFQWDWWICFLGIIMLRSFMWFSSKSNLRIEI